MNYKIILAALCVCFSIIVTHAQVGIGTTTPHPSSMLDVTSTSQGLLAPRMTTVQRNAITNPANSLLVYDTTLKSFFYYDTPTTTWIKINSTSNQRNNYKLIKSVADLAPELIAGGNNKYLLQTNTYYEINGIINLAFPIDLNNAYISGLDANEDVLSRTSGNVFQGTTGGSIRNVTITGGGTVFNITGGTSLLFQNSVVIGMASVGTVSNVGLFFGNIIQFVGNTNGITYNNIGNLLLNNQGWLDSNNGTFETLTGTFGLVEKVSGFSTMNGADIALSVSTNPIVGNGVIFGTVFSGTTTAPSGFINRYTTQPNANYNFDNNWTVNSPGIPSEADDIATANIYFDTALVNTITNNTARKLPVTTTATRLFRATNGGVSNRIRYTGSKSRNFVVNTTFSYTATGGSQFTFSVYKNGVLVPGANVLVNTLVTNQNQSVTILGTVDLSPNDYVEVFMQKTSAGDEDFVVRTFSMIIN